MFCEKCGNNIPDVAHFCSRCGTASSPMVTTTPVAPLSTNQIVDTPAGSSETEGLYLAWENQIRLLSNPDVWRGILMAFGISCALVTVLFLAISKSPWALLVGGGAFAFFILMFVIVGFVIDLFGGFHARFALTTTGIRFIAGKGAGAAADAAFWAGVLLGKGGLAGAGLLAKSEQNTFIAFQDVTEVKSRPGRRNIKVKGGLLQKPIILYCLPDNYTKAEEILRQRCVAAKFV